MSNETATLVKLSAAEQAAAVKKGDVTSRELVEAHLKVIEAAEPSIKAHIIALRFGSASNVAIWLMQGACSMYSLPVESFRLLLTGHLEQ